MIVANSRLLLLLPSSHFKSGSCGISRVITVSYSSSFNAENVPVNVPEPILSSKNAAQFRKGAGGRASFSGNVVTVFGLTGFTGIKVVNRLAKHGNQLILPYRCDPYFLREHKVPCELGQVLFFPYQPRDEESIRKAVKYSNIVISLIGSDISTPNFSIYDSNVEVPARIARISQEMGVERLVHLSAMGANPEHKARYSKNCSFLKTKGLGEQAVRAEFPNATIIRPAVIYGEFDKFIYPFLSRWRKNPLDWVHVYNAGEGIYKMPLSILDFANGVVKAAMDPTAVGKTYEFFGPHCYEMKDLIDFIYAKAGCVPSESFFIKRVRFREPWFLASSLANWLYRKVWRQNKGFINWEWLDFLEATSDVISGGDVLTLKDLGIANLHEFENLGGFHCIYHSFIRALGKNVDEYPVPPLPLRVPPLTKQSKHGLKLRDVQTELRPFGLERKVPSF